MTNMTAMPGIDWAKPSGWIVALPANRDSTVTRSSGTTTSENA